MIHGRMCSGDAQFWSGDTLHHAPLDKIVLILANLTPPSTLFTIILQTQTDKSKLAADLVLALMGGALNTNKQISTH